MFTDEFLEKIFAHPEMQKIPIGTQATAVKAFEEVIEEMKEEKPYANLAELLSEPDSGIPTEF